MGFFDFLRRISEVKEEKKTEKREIKLNDLEGFLDSFYKKEQEKTNLKIIEIREKLEKEKQLLSEKIRDLENAELKNKDIPERAKQVMEGNRNAYCQKIKELVIKVDFPLEIEDILDFITKFDVYFDGFDKGISKNHMVMQEFFVEKAGAILMNVQNIDKLVKDAKKEMENSKIPTLKVLESELKELKQKIKQKQEDFEKVNSLENEVLEIKGKVIERENKLEQFKLEKSYVGFLDKIKEKELTEKELKETEQSFLSLFSAAEQAIKKYENLSKNRVAKRYLENPLESLLEDKDLEILSFFEGAKNAIENGEIFLKDKRKDNALKAISVLDKNYLNSLIEKRSSKMQVLDELNNEVIKSEIKKAFYNLEKELHLEKQRFQEKELEIEKVKKVFENIKIETATKDFENKINESLNEEIRILLD